MSGAAAAQESPVGCVRKQKRDVNSNLRHPHATVADSFLTACRLTHERITDHICES